MIYFKSCVSRDSLFFVTSCYRRGPETVTNTRARSHRTNVGQGTYPRASALVLFGFGICGQEASRKRKQETSSSRLTRTVSQAVPVALLKRAAGPKPQKVECEVLYSHLYVAHL